MSKAEVKAEEKRALPSINSFVEPIQEFELPKKAGDLPRSHEEHGEEFLVLPAIPYFSNQWCFSVSSVAPWLLPNWLGSSLFEIGYSF